MSELKPVGIERDKQIAILRNECPEINCWQNAHYECEFYEHDIDNCGACTKIAIGRKDYADISCAMELWEEMEKEVACICLACQNGDEPHCYIYLTRDSLEAEWADIDNINDKNKAGAISGAYLKWKSHD